MQLEALTKVLNKKIPLKCHCHRADDIATAIRIKNEFNIEKLDSSEYSFGYVASWGSRDLNELKSTLTLISEISNQIFNWISKQVVVS